MGQEGGEGRRGNLQVLYLHHVAFSSLRISCSHPSSGLPLSAVVMRVSFRRGVAIIGSIATGRVVPVLGFKSIPSLLVVCVSGFRIIDRSVGKSRTMILQKVTRGYFFLSYRVQVSVT